MAQAFWIYRFQLRQHFLMGRAAQHGIPKYHAAHVPFARYLCKHFGDFSIILFKLIAGIHQNQTAPRAGRAKRLQQIQAILEVKLGFILRQIIPQSGVFLRVQFGQMKMIFFAQQRGGNHGRAWIGMRPMQGAAVL